MTHLLTFAVVFVSFLSIVYYRHRKGVGLLLPYEAAWAFLIIGAAQLLVSVTIVYGACRLSDGAILWPCMPSYKLVVSMALGAALVVLGLLAMFWPGARRRGEAPNGR